MVIQIDQKQHGDADRRTPPTEGVRERGSYGRFAASIRARRRVAAFASVVLLSMMLPTTCIAGSTYELTWPQRWVTAWLNPLPHMQALATSTSYDFNSAEYPINHNGGRHTGIDIHADPDTAVHAVADGSVAHVVRSVDPGEMVVVLEHNGSQGRFFCIYGHVSAERDLKVGSAVHAGQRIGIVKASGNPCHLHFGINISGSLSDFMASSMGLGWGRTVPISGSVPAPNPRDVGWVDPIEYLARTDTDWVSQDLSPCGSATDWRSPPLEVAMQAARRGREVARYIMGTIDALPDTPSPCYSRASYVQNVFYNQFGDRDVAIGLVTPLGMIEGYFSGHLSADPDDPQEVMRAMEESSCRLQLSFTTRYAAAKGEGMWGDYWNRFPFHDENVAFVVEQGTLTIRADSPEVYSGYGTMSWRFSVYSLDPSAPFTVRVGFADSTFTFEVGPGSLNCFWL